MKGVDAPAPSVARALLLTGLLLAPGVLVAALELRHALPDTNGASSSLDERVQLLTRLRERKASNPLEALAEAGCQIPRGFAVSEISCARAAVGSADTWMVTIQGDPTDAEAANWARAHGRMMAAGHVVDMSFPMDHAFDVRGESPWW